VRIQQLPDGRYRIRWYVAGHGSPKRQRTFSRKKDAERFAVEIERRKEIGELVLFDQANRTVEQLATEWWRRHAAPNLAEWTRRGYRPLLTKHIQPRLGFYRLREITPEVIADFRADLEAAGVDRHAVRVSMVILQSMFKHAIRWRWVPGPNPVQQVEKPSGRRERAVVCLAPVQVEAIRAWLLDAEKLYAATMVSLIAYAGLRTRQELLAVEVRHVGRKTLLVEQRNIDGTIIAGQKVCGFFASARSTSSSRCAATSPSTWSRWASAPGWCSRAATACRGARTTGRTGHGGYGTRRAPAPASSRCRPTTCATRSRRCRSAPVSPCPS
jgi:hypothetical protein